MKLSYRFFLAVSILLVSVTSFSQVEIIEKVFSDKPTNFRSEIEIIDTISSYYSIDGDGYENYYTLDRTTFGADDFSYILLYRHKTLNKCGLIIYGEAKSHYTEPSCDSIYFVKASEYIYTEGYDANGNLTSSYKAANLNFIFEQKNKSNELWEVGLENQNYYTKKIGEVKKATLKAISFSEVSADEYSTKVVGLFANLETNEIINSAVLNEQLVALEAYAYHYDYYEYEYGYESEYATSSAEGSPATFESRLLYSPVEIIYMTSGDTISELINYSYVEASEKAMQNKVLSENLSGVWKTKDYSPDGEIYLIIEGDDVLTDLSTYMFTVDTYDGTFESSTVNWDEMMKKMNLSNEAKTQLESIWKGSKQELSFISSTGWNSMARFKDFIIINDEMLLNVFFELGYENTVFVGMQAYYPEKVYTDYVVAYYDEAMYTSVYKNAKGEVYNVSSASEYYYAYNLAVAEKNIDKEGNLVLTNESLGSIQLKTYSTGNYYVGKIKLSWVGDETYNEMSKVVGMKSLPYKILDQANNVLAEDVSSMYLDNVQGLSLFMITNSDYKSGVLGPDGTWLVKCQYEGISIISPTVSYDDYYSSVRNFPVFFSISQGNKVGLLDAKGNWVVPLEYDYIEACTNNLVTIKDGKMGIYSFEGKKLLENEYMVQGYYGLETGCYGLDSYGTGSIVLSKNGLSGIVDEDFNVLVPFEYHSIRKTEDSKIFIAVNQDDKAGMININNEKLIEFEYDFITPFDYYTNRFVVGKDQKQGVIDNQGNVLIPIEHFSIQTSSDWLSNIVLTYDEYYMTNAIDTTGKSIIASGCGYLYYYPAFEIFYCSSDVNYNFYDRAGNLLYTKISNYIDPYNAYEAVQIAPNWNENQEEPKYGAFDLTTGAEVIPYEFDELYAIWIDTYMFLVGTKKGKLGIYDTQGNELIKPKGMYLDNYFYQYLDDGNIGYFVEISDKKGKSKIIQIPGY